MNDKPQGVLGTLDTLKAEETRKRYSIFIYGSVLTKFEALCKRKNVRVSRAIERYMEAAVLEDEANNAPKSRQRTSR